MEGIKIKSDNIEYKYRNNILKLKKKHTSLLNNGTIEFIGKKIYF